MGKGAVDTLARQWLMLNVLPRAPQRITAGEVAQRLDHEEHPVSKRSVERDLQALSAVFPIECDERSEPFGWSWQRDAPSFNLPGMSSLQAVRGIADGTYPSARTVACQSSLPRRH